MVSVQHLPSGSSVHVEVCSVGGQTAPLCGVGTTSADENNNQNCTQLHDLDIKRNALLTWKWNVYINTPTSNDLRPTGTGDIGRELGCCTRGNCV